MTQTFSEDEAINEAVLLFTRKMRRLHNVEFADIWAKLPDGAKEALGLAERRADAKRDDGVSRSWASTAFDDEE
jgi:hypothetical protein